MAAIETDVLIIGGGVQGLWLLKQLRELNFDAVLVEQHALGARQSCHSHGFLHEGYNYPVVVKRVEELKESAQLWSAWLANKVPEKIHYGHEPAIYGFEEQTAIGRYGLWSKNTDVFGTIPEPAVIPPFLNETAVQRAYKTEEKNLSPRWVIKQLAAECNEDICKIKKITGMEMSKETGRARVEYVTVETEKGTLEIKPGSVVFAAGAGNYDLLKQVSQKVDGNENRTANKQKATVSHMLVVCGPSERFKPLTGAFPDLKLFVVGRQYTSKIRGHSKKITVWFISGTDKGARIEFGDSVKRHTRNSAWPDSVINSLRQLSPKYFGRESTVKLKCGYYVAPMADYSPGPDAERAEMHSDWAIKKFGRDNLWTLYPHRLTLAPFVGKCLASALDQDWASRKKIPTRDRSWRVKCPVSPERWRRMGKLLEWRVFSGNN